MTRKSILGISYVFMTFLMGHVWALEEEDQKLSILSKFSFLSRKYPEFRQEAETLSQEPPFLGEEAVLMAKLGPRPEETFPEILGGFLQMSIAQESFFNSKEHMDRSFLKEETSLKKGRYRSKFEKKIQAFKTLRERTFSQEIILAALQIDHIISSKSQAENPATLVFLGRTPCFVEVALEEFYKIRGKEEKTKSFIHLNFSGHADCETVRAGESFQDKKAQIIRNMTSEKKVAYYFEYLRRKGLRDLKDMDLVDMTGTGGGVCAFLSVLEGYYAWEGCPFPNVTFLALTALVDMQEYDPESRLWSFEEGKDGETYLSFQENKALNVQKRRVKTIPIHCAFPLIERVLDDDLFQRLASHGIEYPPQKWRQEHEEEMGKGGMVYEAVYAHLRLLFRRDILKMSEVFNFSSTLHGTNIEKVS